MLINVHVELLIHALAGYYLSMAGVPLNGRRSYKDFTRALECRCLRPCLKLSIIALVCRMLVDIIRGNEGANAQLA